MPRDSVPGFGARLKAIRLRRSWSQQRLAVEAGTHADSIVKLERGERQPSFELAWRLAKALRVSVADFLPEEE